MVILKVVAHTSTNPARPGLTSELVVSPFSAKIPILSNSFESVQLSAAVVSCGSSLSSRTLIKCFYFFQKSIGYTTIPSPIFTIDQCFPMYPCFVSYFCIPVTWLWRKTKLWFGYCQVGSFHLKLTQINSEMNCIAKNKCPDSQKLDRRRKYGIELICREWFAFAVTVVGHRI